ncbi:MAG: acetylglutamate kinase [Pseudonocardiales bacterium]|nr:MAG: acetylglutamate kinase [Pseudonocardiales bacterium]
MSASAAVLAKAAVLVEALPWLARFSGRTLVVKYGGSAMADPGLRSAFAEDVVFLRYCGISVVVVHGGGPQITAHLDRLGLPAVFAGGLRVTTPETIDVVRMVLVGQVNGDVVGDINVHGPIAVGLSGEDAHLLTGVRRGPQDVEGDLVDLGLVGDIVDVRPDAVHSVLAAGHVPVVASIARSDAGEVLNVNADTVAAALAVSLGAEKLVVLTDVEGLYADWDGSTGDLMSELTAADLRALVQHLAGGMVPKMQACLHAVEGGVPAAHVLDGRVPHALLLEVFTDSGVGTMVTP